MIIYDWFDISWLKSYYNFGFDHFNMSWRKTGLSGLVDCLLGTAGPFASGDWILPDLTIQGSIQLNSHLCTFPGTYYFSYATKRTRKVMGVTVPSSVLGIHPLLFIRVLQMSQWRHPPDVSLPYKGYRYVTLQGNLSSESGILDQYKRVWTYYMKLWMTEMRIGMTMTEHWTPYRWLTPIFQSSTRVAPSRMTMSAGHSSQGSG